MGMTDEHLVLRAIACNHRARLGNLGPERLDLVDRLVEQGAIAVSADPSGLDGDLDVWCALTSSGLSRLLELNSAIDPGVESHVENLTEED